jgi:predicted dehydrogenase
MHMTKPLRFGVIGCGVIGKLHIHLINEIPDAELAAVSDSVPERAKQFGEAHGVDSYEDYREMLKRDDIDVVTVCTPSGMHGDQAIACAEAGKHCIVEKPMDITLEKADKMIAAFRRAGKKLTVISQHRFDPATVKVKKDLEAGKFGKLILGTAAINWYRTQGYYDSGDWRGTWALDGGGVLMNQSIHTIDLLQYFMGPVDTIYAHCATLGHERIEVEDVAVATVKFKSGALGTIVGTTCAYPGLSARIELFGEKGTAIIDADKLVFNQYKDAADEGGFYGAEKKDASGDSDGSADPGAIGVNSHRLQIEDMIAAIREDREPMIPGEAGRPPLEIILAIYKSSQTGQPVKLPLI